MAKTHGALRCFAHEGERLGQKALVGLAGGGALAQAVDRGAQLGVLQRGEAVLERVYLVDELAVAPEALAVAER